MIFVNAFVTNWKMVSSCWPKYCP